MSSHDQNCHLLAEKIGRLFQTGLEIETLMIMGVRSPHMDRQDMAENITMIDDIGLAIFGKTVYEENFSPLPIGGSWIS